MNLRLYVTCDGRPGIWFMSLDAARLAAVWAARRFTFLPYHLAAMSVERQDGTIHYRSLRSDQSGVAFEARYRPTGPVEAARRGTLAHFLTERYCLYAQDPRGAWYRLEIQHQPWPLQPAVADIEVNLVGERQGIRLEGPPPLLHFSRRLDVVGWGLERLAT